MPTQVYSIPKTNGHRTFHSTPVIRIGRLRTLGKNFSIPSGSSASAKNVNQHTSQSATRGGTLENASDKRVLEAFLLKTLKKHRNPRQLLVLSGHGSGAVGDFLSGKRAQQAISIIGLAETLEKVKIAVFGKNKEYKLDIIGMDSCLMS